MANGKNIEIKPFLITDVLISDFKLSCFRTSEYQKISVKELIRWALSVKQAIIRLLNRFLY